MLLLFIDDHRDTADSFADLAKALGHLATVAYDGASARRAIAEQIFDIIFLDLNLPDADGREICAEIRLSATGNASQVIALTGMTELSLQGDMSVFDGYYVKPLMMDDFERLLQHAS
ncbi:response regulator transcription factor [Caballeronia sordidicola]|uniref:response regulator transcription factor n=1 Tax=Caballeronia sordidicola TaxID=196367 RepID=UPI000A3A97FF|nr:response regulator [Caballeronia sordidicola]